MLKCETTVVLFDEMIDFQKKKLLELANTFNITITSDDLLQPNDFPELEYNPIFRYEEGFLAGLQAAKAAFLAEVVKNP